MARRIVGMYPERGILGWLLGERILLLTRTGRTNGRAYQTPLEVIEHTQVDDTYIVAVGWGEQAGWYRNLQRTTETHITVGRRCLAVRAGRLSVAVAARTLGEYAGRHPRAISLLATLLLERREQRHGADTRNLARTLPLVALRPRA